MKSIMTLCLVSLFLLAGCGSPEAEKVQRLEEKISTLEERVTILEQGLQQTRLDLASKENQVAKLQDDLRNVATILDKATVRLDRAERR